MRILFAIAAVGCVCIPAPAAAMTPLQRETALWNASKQGQIDLFAASISPGFVGVYATGTHNRAQEIRGVRSQSLHSFALGNFRTTTVGPDDMLMTYTADAAGSDHGKSFSGHYWETSLWHRTRGKWLTVYHSEVEAK